MSWARPIARVKQYGGSNPSASRETVQRVVTVDALRPLRPGHVAPRDPSKAFGTRIRESARGQDCQVRYSGICACDPAFTIWSHARWGAQLGEAGRGGATKALDIAGAYCCTACDAVYDGQRQAPGLTRAEIDLDWCKGHFRSLGVMAELGII